MLWWLSICYCLTNPCALLLPEIGQLGNMRVYHEHESPPAAHSSWWLERLEVEQMLVPAKPWTWLFDGV
jgi:hypothetical protein